MTPAVPSVLHVMSAGDRATLLGKLDRISTALAASRSPDPHDLASRPGEPERLAIIAPPGGLRERIDLARERLTGFTRPRLTLRDRGITFGSGGDPGHVVLLFPGEGSQRIGMLREAYERLEPVRGWFDALDDAYRRAGEPVPSRLIYPPDGIGAAERDANQRALFDIGYGAQLCTVANLALLQVLEGLGVRADAVLGHSNGEHAAVIAACMDARRDRARICEWLRTASRAGNRVARPNVPEAMGAVGALDLASLEAILAKFPGAVFVAMDNCPLQQVIGGTRAAVTAAAKDIAAAGGVFRLLPFERAYHTPLFASWARALETSYGELPLVAPRLPVVSCLTGEAMAADPDAIRKTMTGQWTVPVRLRAAIGALHAKGARTFIEVGPDSKLIGFVGDILRGQPHLAAAMAAPEQGDLIQIQRLLAALHAHGLQIDPARMDSLLRRPVSEAPRHAPHLVQAQNALIDAGRASLARMESLFAPRLVPAARSRSTRRLTLNEYPFLADHAFVRAPGRPFAVLPFTTSLVMAAEAARRLSSARGPAVLRDVQAPNWLALDGGSLDLTIEAQAAGRNVDVRLAENDRTAFAASVAFGDGASIISNPPATLRQPRRRSPQSFYRDYAFHGPSFRGLKSVTGIGADGIEAELAVTDLAGWSREGDPALLDCVGQMVAFWLLEERGLLPSTAAFPFAAREIVLHGPPPPRGASVQCRMNIALRGETFTTADAALTVEGRPLATIFGFQQRLFHLPPAIASCLFGHAMDQRAPDYRCGIARADLGDWAAAVDEQGGIWARMLAHMVLSDVDFTTWQRHRDTAWLLDRAVALKEAMADGWA